MGKFFIFIRLPWKRPFGGEGTTALDTQDLLRDLMRVDGVRGCAIICKDGFVVEKDLLPKNLQADSDELAVLVTTFHGMARKIVSKMGMPEIDLLNLECPDGSHILIQDLGGTLLVVLADKDATIGKIRFEVKRRKGRIAESLEM